MHPALKPDGRQLVYALLIGLMYLLWFVKPGYGTVNVVKLCEIEVTVPDSW